MRAKKGSVVAINIYIQQIVIVSFATTALFVDMKATFDSVDRRILYKAMGERGIREELIKRVSVVLKETKSRVKVGGEMGESFWTARGVRQGCPLSPML